MPAPNFTYAELEGLWVAAGGLASDAPTAAAIATAESGGCQYALAGPIDVRPVPICTYRQTTGENSFGLWQINVAVHVNYAGPTIWDPATNAAAAVALRNARGNFQDWSTFNDHTYRQFLQVATPPIVPPISSDVFGLVSVSNHVPPTWGTPTAAELGQGVPAGAKKASSLDAINGFGRALGYHLPHGLRRAQAATRQLVKNVL